MPPITNANFHEDGMADDHAPVPLPFRDLILALSQSDVLCSRKLEAFGFSDFCH